MKYTQHKTRLSLVLLALIAGLSACTKEKSEEAKTSSDSATNNQAADTTTPTNSVTAVSYTHLDVYKRQELNNSTISTSNTADTNKAFSTPVLPK